MGARPEDYANAAPYRSYIHVDEFSSHKELADYLHILDQNDELYNSYFKWKGTGEFINTFFWCRVCAMLHDEVAVQRGKWYEDVNEWWRGSGVCSNGSWRNFQARKEPMSDDWAEALADPASENQIWTGRRRPQFVLRAQQGLWRPRSRWRRRQQRNQAFHKSLTSQGYNLASAHKLLIINKRRLWAQINLEMIYGSSQMNTNNLNVVVPYSRLK